MYCVIQTAKRILLKKEMFYIPCGLLVKVLAAIL